MRPHHRSLPSVVVLLLVIACAPPRVVDTHAPAPNYDRWLALVPAGADSAYRSALRVLVDSGYTIRMANNADRILSTNVRSRATADKSYNVRFTVFVEPAGSDSARVSITGESCYGDNLEQCALISAVDYGDRAIQWRFVRRLGDALLERLR